MTLIIGVDPGKSGGMAVLSDGRLLDAIPMPLVGKDIDAHGIRDFIDAWGNSTAVVALEEVHSLPRQGVASTFTFGMGYGIVIGVALGAGYAMRMVRPAEWKRLVGIPAGSEKDASFAKATMLFPDMRDRWKLKKHDGVAEAALIAEAVRIRDGL